VYEIDLRKLERRVEGLGYYAFSGDGLINETNQIVFLEAAYHENCVFLKKIKFRKNSQKLNKQKNYIMKVELMKQMKFFTFVD